MVCDEHSLFLHLDGARLFNALVAKNELPQAYGRLFHSISVCLNKGLGCPIGSILIGESAFIKKARRVRKVFGGGMRQAGFMAAAGLYALQNHIVRLQQDHQHARDIAAALAQKEFIENILPVDTNIIIFSIRPPHSAHMIAQKLRQENMLVYAISPMQIRMVLHLDITPEMVGYTIKVIDRLSV
jgi:threonine aldolase